MQLLCNGFQPFLHPLVILAGEHQRQKNIVPDTKGVQQIKVLEHKSQLFSSKYGQLLFRNRRYILPAQQHFPPSRPIQGGDNVEQRSLT